MMVRNLLHTRAWVNRIVKHASFSSSHKPAADVADLFNPLRVSDRVKLAHRIVLAPLTRNRASEPGLAPRDLHVEYYSQRATSGGLLITEATPVSAEGVGYLSVPGIWTDEQVKGWKRVTEAVHAKGGYIFAQLWHTGRIAHPSYAEHPLLRESAHPPSVSASAVPMTDPTGKLEKTVTYKGTEDAAVPRPLREDEMERLKKDFQNGAKRALEAGFDGVELHGAHGYLIDQFLQNGTNQRTDKYGGSVENRCRLLFEIVEDLVAVMGEKRVGVRLSPTTIDPVTKKQNQLYFGASTTDPDELYAHAASGLNQFPLAYLFLTEPRFEGTQPLTNHKYRKIYKGTLMAAGGFTPTTAAQALRDGYYDLIAFGRWFISNPDLPERIRTKADLNQYERKTFYSATVHGGGAEGYTDYPDLQGKVGVQGKYPLVPQSKLDKH